MCIDLLGQMKLQLVVEFAVYLTIPRARAHVGSNATNHGWCSWRARRSLRPKDSLDGEHELLPMGVFRFQPTPTDTGERVHARSSVVLRWRHLGFNIATHFETM